VIASSVLSSQETTFKGSGAAPWDTPDDHWGRLGFAANLLRRGHIRRVMVGVMR
jgi:hypothetical protein